MGKTSIMRQLWMLTMFLVGIIALLGAFTFWRSTTLFTALDATANKQLPAVRCMTLADMLHDGLRAVVIESLYKGNKNQISELKTVVEEKDEKVIQFHGYIDKLLALELSAKTEKEVADSKPALKNYTDISSRLVNLASEGKVAEAELLLPEFEKSFSDLEVQLEKIGENIESEASTFSASGSNTLYMIGSISILGIILGFFFSMWAIRNLKNFIQGFLHEVVTTSENISSVSARLSSANNQFSSSATEGAASLQETVASLDELSSMVSLNTESAQKASEVSILGRESAEKGEKEIIDLSNAMNDIKSSSRKMEDIINTIDEIAFQTNLLALNAAVEAARAGEQGRGFAVVAEAVRSLAQRSSSAAKDISTMIKESINKIDSGGKYVDSSKEALHTIFNSIKEVSDLNQQIATASTEQSAGIKQISHAMNQLDAASQQTATGAQEVSLISDQMFEESTRLGGLIQTLSQRFMGASSNANRSTKAKDTPVKTEKVAASRGGVVINLEEASNRKPLFDKKKISNLNDF